MFLSLWVSSASQSVMRPLNNSELYFSFFLWWRSCSLLVPAETGKTLDWAVKLECQAGINLPGYVHINMLIICSVEMHCGPWHTLDIQGDAIKRHSHLHQRAGLFATGIVGYSSLTNTKWPTSFSHPPLFFNSLNRRWKTIFSIMCGFPQQRNSKIDPRKNAVTCLYRKWILCHARLV